MNPEGMEGAPMNSEKSEKSEKRELLLRELGMLGEEDVRNNTGNWDSDEAVAAREARKAELRKELEETENE